MYHDADKYIILGMPRNVYYHKHLMYNAAIFAARGEIVCFCDSDAIYKNTFVASILNQFTYNPHIVLYLDQVRNNNRAFYPFNFPPLATVLADRESRNWHHGSNHGLIESANTSHAQLRRLHVGVEEDLLKIGGADKHFDYLGYICGPHDMGFRLVNSGCREVWHPSKSPITLGIRPRAGQTITKGRTTEKKCRLEQWTCLKTGGLNHGKKPRRSR